MSSSNPSCSMNVRQRSMNARRLAKYTASNWLHILESNTNVGFYRLALAGHVDVLLRPAQCTIEDFLAGSQLHRVEVGRVQEPLELYDGWIDQHVQTFLR